MMTFGLAGMKHPSLAALVDSIKMRISREALHLRFTANAVEFMKKCVAFVFQQKANALNKIDANMIRHFKKIHIVDSTSWDVHPLLKSIFPGSGGSASVANCKVQLCYEYIQGLFSFFEVLPGTHPDSRYSATLPEKIQKDELLIADLGYFCILTLYRICERGAFFLNRFYIGTTIMIPETSKPLNLLALLQKVTVNAFELPVLLGPQKNNQVACRMIALRVNDKVASERRRKLIFNAQKKGRTPSQEHLFMAGWILMVTNAPQEWIPAEMVRPFYSLRWQIELLFKQWKSVLDVDSSSTSKEPRLQCELLGRLLVASLIQQIHSEANISLWKKEKKEISFDKLYKRFQERLFLIKDKLLLSIQEAETYINIEVVFLLKNCRKLIQLSRDTTLHFLEFGKIQKIEILKIDLLT